jgi:hydroxyethylthiazole kinase
MSNYLEKAAQIVDAVRKENPLVDCITNVITVNDCANILLAYGASPAMCDVFDESYEFASISSALYINLGSFNREQEGAALEAVLAAKQKGIPVVIDPVGCAVLPKRIRIIEHILSISKIDLIKGNMGEIMALAGCKAEVKGVDSKSDIQGIEDAAKIVAKKFNCTVVATGRFDIITDGNNILFVGNGVEMLSKITGAGCMLGAVCAATCAVAKSTGADILSAALAAVLSMGIAGEKAFEKAQVPGSFRVALIDSFFTLTGSTLMKEEKVQC